MPTITSQKPNRAAQLTLRPFTLLCTLVLLTFGVAHAQEISPEGEDLGRVSKRPAKGEGQQGAVARILAGVDEGKISKERAAEMVKALNKNINQEDHANLKKMLEEYWKADPSIRGLLSTRIEGYLQHLQMGRSPAREAASQGRGERRGRGERPVSPAVTARLRREVGSYDSTARIDMEAVGQDGGVINLRGTADAQVILNGQLLLNRSLLGGNESVTIIGADPGDAEYFSLSMDGNRTTFGYTIGGMERGEARVMKDPFSDRTVRTTFDNAGGSTTSVLVGPQQAEFMTVTHTRARRQPTDVLETMLSSPVKPAGVNRSANSPDPGANFSPEHLVLQEFAGDFEAEGKEGKVRSRMICQGRFLVSEGAAEDNDTVTFTGFDSARRVFQHVILDPEMPGFRYLEGTRQEDGAIVFAARDGRDDLTLTLSRHDDGGYTLDDGKRSMRFRSNVDKASRGVAGEGAGQRRGDTTKSPQRPKQGGGEKGAVARILAGVDEGKISKEKAAEMVAALNKNSDQEDPDLKNMLDDYWKADPSIRGLLSTRIEGYLQWKADNQGRNSERTDQGRGDAAESQQRAAQDGAEEKEGPLLSELPEEDALEVLYQRMLRDHPGIKDISKERLMPRLRAMLEEELARERSGTREGGNARGARGNDRAVDGSDQKVPGTLKWSVPLGGGVGYHSPAIAEDGTVYMAGDRQRLVAMNPDGTVKWTFVARSGYPIAGAAIGKDGTIYIGTWSQDGSDSRIYAITADGTEKWSYPVGDKIEFSSPAIGKDGTIYIGCYDDHLYAMNPDGTLRWRFRADFNLMSSPAVGQDGTIYIASENGKLYAVNPEDGSKKWDFQTGNYIHGSPSIAKDGTVYIGSSDKHLYAIAPKDGSEKWRFAAKDQVHAPPAIGEDGTLYVGSNDGNFYALNPDGTEKWRFKTGKRVDNGSAAIGRDGTIYFGSDDNHIYALNPDGSEKWRFAMGGVDDMDSSPAIGVDGTIYVGSMDGNLYAIHGESGGLADTPWPMFGGDLRHTGRAHSTFHSAGGAQKGAVARILAGVDEGKLSKEKATEMVKALNKNIDQEDPTLKFLLNQYWKADPSVRGALSTRIEGYLQHKAARQNRENKDADQVQNRDDEPTSEQAKAAAQYNVEPANKGLLKIVTDVAKGKTSIEKAADAIATMYKEFGVKKDDSTVKKQLEMATEFNESERMHKWFTLCIEVYIKKTFIEPANQESEAQEKEK